MNALDKEEFRIKLEEINKLVQDKDYKGAMNIVDSIDWRRVKNVRTLCVVGEIYAANGRYEDSKEIFLLAYHKASIGKNILYRLIEISLRMDDINEAEEFFEEYKQVASNDSTQYILQYKIARAKNSSLNEQIRILEEYKEQEWKNIEVAVELDRPELYERYLSMKFRDFMDWYWNVNGAKELGKRMPVPERIYVGNAFCHLLFPEKRQLFEILKKAESEGLSVTVTFSYLREFMLKPVENLLDELKEWCRNRETFLEIAANDWGLLELLRERKEWKEEKEALVPCMGTLLNKRKKDPRMGYKQGETGYFRENSLNAEFYRTYLRDTFGIRRYEWESCGYRQQFPEGKNSIHVPFYQTNTSQYCTLYAVCKNGERGKQELPESCPGYCREKVFLYPKHLKMVGRYNSLFALDGSAVSGMADTEGWKEKRIDRIVVNLL